jgi:cation:H+ antiporter
VLLLDGQLSRVDGILMMCVFFAWLIATIIEARRQRSAVEEILHPIDVDWRAVFAALIFGMVALGCS